MDKHECCLQFNIIPFVFQDFSGISQMAGGQRTVRRSWEGFEEDSCNKQQWVSGEFRSDTHVRGTYHISNWYAFHLQATFQFCIGKAMLLAVERKLSFPISVWCPIIIMNKARPSSTTHTYPLSIHVICCDFRTLDSKGRKQKLRQKEPL